jgi:hypothetical protein
VSEVIIEPIVCETVINLPPEKSVRFFTERFGESRVILTHKYFERHGADAPGYRADMASDYGWPLLLQMSAAAANG